MGSLPMHLPAVYLRRVHWWRTGSHSELLVGRPQRVPSCKWKNETSIGSSDITVRQTSINWKAACDTRRLRSYGKSTLDNAILDIDNKVQRKQYSQ